MSTALPLVLHRPHDCVVNLELVRKVQLLKREREGRVGAAHARDRCLEVVKARVLDGGGNLRREGRAVGGAEWGNPAAPEASARPHEHSCWRGDAIRQPSGLAAAGLGTTLGGVAGI